MPFEVPESWVWTTIDELCDVVRGGSPRPAGDEKYYNGAIPFLKVADLTKDDGIYVYKAEYTIKEAGLKKTRLVNEGTLLLTNSGATLGVPKITTFPTTFNDGIAAFLYMNREVQLYLYWFIKSKTDSLRKIDQGAAQPNLNTDLIKSIPIPLPPLTEQFRIIKEIEHWFALIDQIEQDKADLQTIIKQTKSKILDLAIHGKLVPQAPNDEPAIELLKRINPDFTPCDNGHYPIGWIETILGELFSHNTGKALNSSNKEGIFKDYLTTSNVYWNKFDFTVVKQMPFKESELDKCTITKGDLLVCEGGDIGRSAIWNYDYDICIQNHIHRLRPKIDLCVPFYYYTFAYLKENNLIGGKGIGLLGLSSNALHKIELPLPPLAEQQRIVQKIEELFSVLDNIQKALEV